MTYDPDRDTRAPADVSPNRRPYERSGVSAALMLCLMAAFVAVGFWLYMTNDSNVATDNRPAAERTTTGAAPQERPLPETPTPPTVPSQPRQ
jgi:hypothetical protein